MPPDNAADHLRAVAQAETLRLRELASLIVERLRQYEETNGRLPPVVYETVGADLIRQVFASSDRLEAIGCAIDAYNDLHR